MKKSNSTILFILGVLLVQICLFNLNTQTNFEKKNNNIQKNNQPISQDSTMNYSSFYGGVNTEDWGFSALDSQGNIIVGINTASSTLTTTSNVYDPTFNGVEDVFIMKLTPDAKSTIWAAYYGGSGAEVLQALEVDSKDNIIFYGATLSTDNSLPLVNAYQTSFGGGERDFFIAKLNSTGTNLIFSTYFGGNNADQASPNTMTITTNDDIYVTGVTWSTNFPTTSNAFYSSLGGGKDSVLFKFDPTGVLNYSTYWGGSNTDDINDVYVDNATGLVYICGNSFSNFISGTSGAYKMTFTGTCDAYIAKLDIINKQILNFTWFGSSSIVRFTAFDLDDNGDIYAGGFGPSTIPTTLGAFNQSYCGGTDDFFLARFDNNLTTLKASTFLGGKPAISNVWEHLIIKNGFIYFLTIAQEEWIPITYDALDSNFNGNEDSALFVLNSDLSKVEYCTWIGGSDNDYLHKMIFDSNGYLLITGVTSSTNYPITTDSVQPTLSGSYDFVLTKLNLDITIHADPLVYSSFYGSSSDDEPWAYSTFDLDGNLIVGISTTNSTMPATSGVFDETFNGVNDVFIMKLTSDGKTLIWGTYFGGTGRERIKGIAVDSQNNIIFFGETMSSDNSLPLMRAYQSTYGGGERDMYVAKLNSAGSVLNFSTYFGGSSADAPLPNVLLITSNDDIYFGGESYSSNFPVTPNAIYLTYQGGIGDGAIVKLNSTGSLKYSTYIGGSAKDGITSISMNNAGDVYFSGYTYGGFRTGTLGAYQTTALGGLEGFLGKIDNNSGQILNFTWFSSTGSETMESIVFDEYGNVYVCGQASALTPTTVGAFNQTYGGGSSNEYYLAKFDKNLSTLMASTFVGGKASAVRGCLKNYYKNGILYFLSISQVHWMPFTLNAFDSTFNGAEDNGLYALNSNLDRVLYCSVIGGSGNDLLNSICFDSDNNIVLTGVTTSSNYPTTPDAFKKTFGNVYEAVLIKMNLGISINTTLSTPLLQLSGENANSTGNYNLTWNAVEGADNFSLYRDTTTFETISGKTPIYTGVLCEFQEIDLTNGTYYYRVLASNITGNSSLSNEIVVNVQKYIPNPPIQIPAAPILQIFGGNINTTGTYNLTWIAVNGASNYSLYRDNSPIESISGKTPVYTGINCEYQEIGKANGFYYYCVIASNMSGNSSLSNQISVNVQRYVPITPPTTYWTNGVWQNISIGVNKLVCNDSTGKTYISMTVITSVAMRVRLCFNESLAIFNLDYSRAIAYYSIEFDNPTNATATIAYKFYYNLFNLSSENKDKLQIFGYQSNQWINQNATKSLSDQSLSISWKGVQFYCLGHEEKVNNNSDSPFAIPGFSLEWISGITLFTFALISHRLNKKKRINKIQ